MATYISNTTANTTWIANITVITAARLNTENTNILANDIALDTALALSHDSTGYFNPTVGSDVASTNALTLGTGNIFDITGTTAITSIGTKGTGYIVWLQFDGILTLTHHATDLILPDDSNITTAAGDVACLYEYASADWRLISYSRSDATSGVLSVANGGTGATTLTDGGILLGSGTSAITAMSVLADGSIIVGDGATDPVELAAFTSSTGTLKHEKGGVEADISAIADGGIVVGTGAGTMAIRASALTGGASGYIKHELGGIEANISAIADGGMVVGTGTGTMAIRASALTGGASGYIKHELGGVEADISAIADGGIVVGTGAGTMAIRTSALTGGASGYIKHELGGTEADLSAVADGDVVVGTGAGSMGLESGATFRTTVGLGTGDSPQFTNPYASTSIELGHATDTTLTRSAAGELAVEGTDVKKVGKETIWIPVEALTPATTQPCGDMELIEAGTNDVDYNVMDFDTGSDEYANFRVQFPKSWNESTVTFQVAWTSSATDTDGVAWGLQGVALADDETIDSSWGAAVVVTDDNISAAGDMLITSESSAVTIAGSPGVDETVIFRIFRDVSDANDDMAEDARLLGIRMFFTTDASTDT